MAETPGRQYLPEKAEQAFGTDEKTGNTALPSPDYPAQRKMPSARSFIFALLVLFSVAFGLGNAAFTFPNGRNREDDQSGSGDEQVTLDGEDSSFAKLLSSASPDALHQLLHAYFPHTFRHGVYPSDESAVEAVHANDAALATSLVSLARRQDNGSSTTSESTTVIVTSITVTTTTTQPADPTTTTTTTQQPPSSTTTGGTEGTTTVVSTETTPPETTTKTEVTPPDTTSKAQTTAPTSNGAGSDTTPAGTSKATSSLPTTTAVVPSPPLTSTQVVTSTSILSATTSTSAGTTLSTTKSSVSSAGSAGSAGSTGSTTESLFTSSHTSTFVSTLPGGAVTTITTVEVVTGGRSQATTTSGGAGSLQTGNAAPNPRRPMIEAVVGLVIGGALLA